MAAKFETEMTRAGDMFSDLPENIRLAPELNGRHEHTDVEALAADIEAHGQHTPVIIRKDDEGYPVLVAGHRRYRAITLLNERNETKRKVLCTYRSNISPLDALRYAISENRFRKDVSPIDDAANMALLRDKFALTETDIAAIYFPETPAAAESLRFVRQRLPLVELASEAAQAVRDGRVKLTAAVALAKLSKAQQRAKVATPGKVRAASVTEKKVFDLKALKECCATVLAEADNDPDAAMKEVSREGIEALRAALNG